MESLPHTKSNPWKISSSNREMKGIISDAIPILIFTHTPTGGKQVTFNKKMWLKADIPSFTKLAFSHNIRGLEL